jgi:hypothetical protein
MGPGFLENGGLLYLWRLGVARTCKADNSGATVVKETVIGDGTLATGMAEAKEIEKNERNATVVAHADAKCITRRTQENEMAVASDSENLTMNILRKCIVFCPFPFINAFSDSGRVYAYLQEDLEEPRRHIQRSPFAMWYSMDFFGEN